MLRRPPTAITLTQEDIAAYETRRLQREYDEQQQQSQSQSSGRTQQNALSADSSFNSSSSQDQQANAGGSTDGRSEVRAAMRATGRTERVPEQRQRDLRSRAERIGVSRPGT